MYANYFKLKQLIELGIELGFGENEMFVSIVRRLSVRWNEDLYQKTLEMIIHSNFRPLMNTDFQIPIKPEDLEAVDGPYKIGTIANTDIEFGFTPLQLQMHGVIGGQSGFGKSTLIKVLCPQIMKEGEIKTWLIDPKEGGDYRFLARQFQNTLILRPDVMRCNPFNMIKNVPARMLRESVSEVTADSFSVFDASESVITEHVQRIFEEHEQPNMYDFISSVWSEKNTYGRRAGYLDTIKSRLSKIKSSLGDIVDCKTDYFSELYDRDVVFEVGSLSGSAQRLLVPWIIMKLVLYKIRNKTDSLSHLLVFDEAQTQIWSRYLEMRGRQSYMATLATQARAFGLGILVLCQEPSMKLMREITANSNIKIALHLGDGDEVQGFGRSMGLNYDQMDAMYHFDRGEAVCRVGMGFTEPVRLELYDSDDQPVSDDQLAELMRPQWDRLLANIEPAKPDQETQPQLHLKRNAKSSKTDAEVRGTDGKSEETGIPDQASRAMAGAELSRAEQAYLRIAASHPWRLLTELYRLLGDENVMGTEQMSQSQAVRTRQKLLKKGYLENFRIAGIGRSGKHQCDIVKETAGLGKVAKPRGGYLHAWWCHRVSIFFRNKGAEVKIGDTSSGNECDLGIVLDGKRLGAEIVISGLVVDNLTRYISSGHYDEVLVLCIDSKKREEVIRLTRSLSNDVRSKIKIQLLKGYYIAL